MKTHMDDPKDKKKIVSYLVSEGFKNKQTKLLSESHASVTSKNHLCRISDDDVR